MDAVSWMDLDIFDPPPDHSLLQNENYTLVQDEYGHWYFVNKNDHNDFKASGYHFIGSDIIFKLYTPKNPGKSQKLILNDKQVLKKSNFNPKLPTRIFIHGFNSDGKLIRKFARAYFSKGSFNLNFIGVNWEKGSNVPSYLEARENIKIVGAQVALFIDFLVANGMKLLLLAMFGHSLGAHAMGLG